MKWGLVVVLCFGALALSFAIYLITAKTPHTETTPAVTEEKVSRYGSKSVICCSDVVYEVAGKSYKGKIKGAFKAEAKIDIEYNPNDPTDISYKEVTQSTVAELDFRVFTGHHAHLCKVKSFTIH
ncbi:hypothetical protein M427DRAFT_48486 [Gonapodya prolifera JEL478]|uniref:Uncharacterized protein n=1 Tax=Gonapodya prolifera (strain JEL478) TaxID=1344416 RepID=A0A139A0E6_GONPJ|nr:hypothetical protein M427DRAFT_48486 [Gonapodya prolifera JEL478]|eukprot:KXS10194.1 hypothetical protein M427DRAFT_48486 [Gonapodya prolifera JEL478]